MLKLPNGDKVVISNPTVRKAKLVIAKSLEEFYPSIVLYQVDEDGEIVIFKDPGMRLPQKFAVLVDDPYILQANPFSEEEWLAIIVEHALIEDLGAVKRAVQIMKKKGIDGQAQVQDSFFHLISNDPQSEQFPEQIFGAAKTLIAAGAKINMINTSNKEGETALTKCAYLGRHHCSKILLELGANMNMQNQRGDTPLIAATRQGDVEMMREYIKRKCNLDLMNKAGDTALMLTVVRNRLDLAKILIKGGCNANRTNKEGDTPLIKAVEMQLIPLVIALIQAGADVNFKNHRAMNVRKIAKAFDTDRVTDAIDYAIESIQPKKTNDYERTGYIRVDSSKMSGTVHQPMVNNGAPVVGPKKKKDGSSKAKKRPESPTKKKRARSQPPKALFGRGRTLPTRPLEETKALKHVRSLTPAARALIIQEQYQEMQNYHTYSNDKKPRARAQTPPPKSSGFKAPRLQPLMPRRNSRNFPSTRDYGNKNERSRSNNTSNASSSDSESDEGRGDVPMINKKMSPIEALARNGKLFAKKQKEIREQEMHVKMANEARIMQPINPLGAKKRLQRQKERILARHSEIASTAASDYFFQEEGQAQQQQKHSGKDGEKRSRESSGRRADRKNRGKDTPKSGQREEVARHHQRDQMTEETSSSGSSSKYSEERQTRQTVVTEEKIRRREKSTRRGSEGTDGTMKRKRSHRAPSVMPSVMEVDEISHSLSDDGTSGSEFSAESEIPHETMLMSQRAAAPIPT